MSRRANRRATGGQGTRVKGKSSVMKWVWRTLPILALLIILAGFALYSKMQAYLRSDEFRVFVGNAVGDVMNSKAEFAVFEWEGLDVSTKGFRAESPHLMRKMEADGLQARLSLEGVRQGVWEISDLRVSHLDVELSTVSSPPTKKEPSNTSESTQATNDTKGSGGGFLADLLPDRAELMSAQIMRMNLKLKTSSGGFTATDMAMRVDGGRSAGSYDLHLSDGEIKSPWFGSPLDLVSARGKYQHGRLFITESRSKVYERGLLTLDGELEGRDFGFFGTLKDVRCEELVPEDWQKRLTGNVETQFRIKSGGNGVTTKGKIEIKQGVLTALPVLDTIAAYANSRRFRRLNLSEAKLNFKREGKRLILTNIVMASEGLVRVEGDLTIIDRRLDGRFMVGVMPGTLAHIPGAETKVFLRGKKGLLWSPLRITGTMDDPQEDLSGRMIAAAQERMFELVPETGKMVLKFAHDSAVQLPAKAVETGAGVIKEGSGVIQEGVRGVFDLLPGGREE